MPSTTYRARQTESERERERKVRGQMRVRFVRLMTGVKEIRVENQLKKADDRL